MHFPPPMSDPSTPGSRASKFSDSASSSSSNKHTGRSSLPTPGGGTHSFWQKDRSKILLGHRTTKELPKNADVVVVGSGISGAFASYELMGLDSQDSAEGFDFDTTETTGRYPRDDGSGGKGGKRGLDVVMLEAREAVSGATGRNGGHCQPKLYSNPPHIGAFELANFEYLRELVMELGIKDAEWKDVESCHGYYDEELFYPQVAAVEALKALAPELGELVDVITPHSENPSMKDLKLSSRTIGAIVTKKAASVWPYKLVAFILERLLENNGSGRGSFNLQTNTPATKLQKVDGGWIVHTPRGMIGAKKVLLTTNAYTSHLLPKFNNLIVPVKEEMTALLPPKSLSPSTGRPLLARNSYCFYTIGKDRMIHDEYLVQRPFGVGNSEGGELMFGGGRQLARELGVGVSDDSFIEREPVEYLQNVLGDELKLHNEHKPLETSWVWTGIMGFSRDNRPWVGSVPDDLGGGEGLFICGGFTGHGMPNASLCAKAVAKIMLRLALKEEELPREFYVSATRADRAMQLADVRVADYAPLTGLW